MSHNVATHNTWMVLCACVLPLFHSVVDSFILFVRSARHNIVFIKLKSNSVITLVVYNEFDALSVHVRTAYTRVLLLGSMVILQCDGHL